MKKRSLIITVLITVLLLTFFLSCAVDAVFQDPSGILEDQYARKDIPEIFLSNLEATSTDSITGSLVPEFNREVTQYYVGIRAALGERYLTLRATVSNPDRVRITLPSVTPPNGGDSVPTVASGVDTVPILIQSNENNIPIVVTALDGSTNAYIVTAIGLQGTENNVSALAGMALDPPPANFTFASGTEEYNDIEFQPTVRKVIVTPTPSPGANGLSKIYINGRLMTGPSQDISLAVGMNRVDVQVVAEDYSSTTYKMRIRRLEPDVYGLLISEWAAVYSKDVSEDFIELRNYGSREVTIKTNFKIYIGTTAMTLTKCGTTRDLTGFKSLGSAGVKVAPGEYIVIVESGITPEYLDTFISNPDENYRTPAGTKFFLASEKKLIGVRKKLHESQAYLEMIDGDDEYRWSYTPSVDEMVEYNMNKTVNQLRFGFQYGVDSTDDVTKWRTGDRNSRTPGKESQQ